MYIDIHAHILPSVDDGAKSTEEAIRLLGMLKQQNVGAVALSPHFYPTAETSFDGYIHKITQSFNALRAVADESKPELYLGSEVYFFSGLANLPEIERLCIGNSKFILIELPYRDITHRTLDEIAELNFNRGLTPVMAHIERYSKFVGFNSLLELIDDGYALGQVNASSLLHFGTRRRVLSLIKNGCADFLASDCHSVEKLPPHIDAAFTIIRKKIGDSYAEMLIQNNEEIYKSIKGVVNEKH